MCAMRSFLLGVFVCFMAVAASANSVTTIPITGTAEYGFSLTYGDFNINGSGLSLFQGLPQGPAQIGSCTIGAVCNFSWGPSNSSEFCNLCVGLSEGTIGSTSAQYLSPNLTFKGSAFYSGTDTLNMNFTVSGTITGYELINCSGGVGCSLGPKVFTIYISGHGTEQLVTYGAPFMNQQEFTGVGGTFTGMASTSPLTTPEPASLILIGTGLAGVAIRRKFASYHPSVRHHA